MAKVYYIRSRKGYYTEQGEWDKSILKAKSFTRRQIDTLIREADFPKSTVVEVYDVEEVKCLMK